VRSLFSEQNQLLVWTTCRNAAINGSRRSLFDQLSVINFTGPVVQYDNPIQLPFVLKPSMLTAFDVQHHARNRPSRPRSSVPTTLPLCGYQAGALQQLLHPW